MTTAAGRSRTTRHWYRDPAVQVTTAVAAVLALAYLAAPVMGGDLAAQLARADFARNHPLTPVDLRWFGGVLPFGYSAWTPTVMAVAGSRVTGAVATVVATVLVVVLFGRTAAARPMWGGIAAAITLAGDLAEGRVTFACGVAWGLAALVALAGARARPRRRRALAAGCALVAGLASPVAALLLGVCAAALVLRRRIADAAVLLLPGVVAVAVTALLFRDGGRAVFNPVDAARALAATLVVAALVPRRFITLRLGALVGAVMVVLAWALPTGVGGNAARLSLLFAVPVVAAYLEPPRVRGGGRPAAVVAAVALTALVQTPVTFGTLSGAGAPATRPAYYAAVLAAIRARGPLSGRVEVPELTGHWEAVYLARHVALARGWLRQADTELNDDVFYAHPPTAATYRAFLDRTAVQYVAVASARATYYGRRETALIRRGLPYLERVWSDPDWTLYAVRDARPMVAAPATLVAQQADRLVLDAPADTDVTVRVRWWRWLSLDGPGRHGCLREGGGHVVLHTGAAGRYTLGSRLPAGGPTCR